MGRRKQKNPVGVYQQNVVEPRCPDFYRLAEEVGSESRSIEFKIGPGFIQHELRQGVAKYMCGFINSTENGTLMIGVEDTGSVKGYHAYHSEVDRIRIQIDESMKDIKPNVFPPDYSVDFIPVYDSAGNQPILDLWVIEIHVDGARIGGRDRLYQTKQGVFMRRDGTLEGPLDAQQIQEWTKRRYQSETDKLKNTEANLRNEMQRKQRDFDNRDTQLRQREEALAEAQRRHQAEMAALSDKNRQLQGENNVLQAENQTLKNSSTGIQQDLGEIKTMLSKQGHKQSRVCVVS